LDKRTRIIRKTACLIHSKGYENTSLSDVLTINEIGKGQFYHYFSSKKELGLAVLDDVFAYWNRTLLDDILCSNKPPQLKIIEMLEWMINLQKKNDAKHGCIFGNLAIEMSESDELFREKLKHVFDVWVSKFKDVLREILPEAQASDTELEGGTMLMKNHQDLTILINITEMAKKIINDFIYEHRIA
jgi:TetR/AcrR family transcriptional regulator, transcriptional repressor for nem operon